jgi:hypothetical protein
VDKQRKTAAELEDIMKLRIGAGRFLVTMPRSLIRTVISSIYRRRFCSTRSLARYGPYKTSRRHSITLTTATPIATAKAKSRTSSMTIFRIPDATGSS